MDEVERCKVTGSATSAPTLSQPASHIPIEYPSSDLYATYSCVKCDDRFISEGSLEEHMKDEHRKKEARCIICGFLSKTTFKLNEHIADQHPLPRKVQNFGNYLIEDGNVVFSDEDDDDDYDASKEDTQESEEEEDEEEAEHYLEREEAEGEVIDTLEEEDDEEGEEEEEAQHEEGVGEEGEVMDTLEEGEGEEGDNAQHEEGGGEKEVQHEEGEVQGTAPKEARQQVESYPCNECNSVFSFEYPLRLHIKNNHKGKLKCEACNYRCNTIRKIEEHERDHHGPIDGESVTEERIGGMEMIENIFDFGNQKKRKPNPTQLLKSKQKKAKTDGSDGRFVCEDCECDYARKDGLKKHRAAKH